MRHRLDRVQVLEVKLELNHEAAGVRNDQVEQHVAQPVDPGVQPVLPPDHLRHVVAALEQGDDRLLHTLDRFELNRPAHDIDHFAEVLVVIILCFLFHAIRFLERTRVVIGPAPCRE